MYFSDWLTSLVTIFNNINILSLVEGNTLNQRQYVLFYTECPFFNNTLKHFSNITLKLMNNSDIN